MRLLPKASGFLFFFFFQPCIHSINGNSVPCSSQWPNQLWEHFLLLSCPLLFSPRSDLAGAEQRREGERKGTCLHVRFTHTQRGGKKKIKLLRHARMRTRTHACTPTHACARHLIQRGTTMGTCEKKENGEKSGCWKGNTFRLRAGAQMADGG